MVESAPEVVEEAAKPDEPIVEQDPPADETKELEQQATIEEVKIVEPENDSPSPPKDEASKDIVDGASDGPKDNSALDDALPVVAEAAAAIAVGAIAAEVISDDKPVTDKAIVEEPEQLAGVEEEPGSGEAPSSPKSDKDKRKHRSSRHSRSSHHSSSSKDVPREERPHHKRRETEPSPKSSSSPKTSPRSARPTRHDSGVSTGSTGSHRHRKDRTPEEQAAHDKRKEEKRAKLREAEELLKAAPSESAIIEEHDPIPAIPRRVSSSRRYSSGKSATSHGSTADGDKKPNILGMKGVSIVKNPFVATDKSHIKEVVEKVKPPIIDRPRFSMDHERPKLSRRETTSHHTRSHRREKEESDRAEEERKARKSRKESEKAMAAARAQVAEDNRKLQEKEDEERRLRREERRLRRAEMEALEKTSEVSGGKASEGSADKGKDVERPREGETVRSKERVHRHRHRREKEKEREKEKPKGPLTSLFSSVKKVFK